MTTTEEQFTLDNSEQENELSLSNEDKNLNSEPEENQSQAVSQSSNFGEIEIPEKFKNKDGSLNQSALIKSYKELEPLINEKALWVKEKNVLNSELSKFKGQNINPLTQIRLGLYEKNLESSSNQEKAKELIEKLKQGADENSMKELESLFPSELNQNILFDSAEIARETIKEKIEHLKEAEAKSVEGYLKEVVEKNFDALKNPVTAEIFNEAFIQFGSNLDSEWFFGKMNELKNSFILEYQKEQSAKNEAEGAVKNAGGISPNSSTKGGTSLLKRNALELSSQELNQMLDEYYSR